MSSILMDQVMKGATSTEQNIKQTHCTAHVIDSLNNKQLTGPAALSLSSVIPPVLPHAYSYW
eukprot:scaffold1407_cov69-Cyclotella_meneghiniana.AAC.4